MERREVEVEVEVEVVTGLRDPSSATRSNHMPRTPSHSPRSSAASGDEDEEEEEKEDDGCALLMFPSRPRRDCRSTNSSISVWRITSLSLRKEGRKEGERVRMIELINI